MQVYIEYVLADNFIIDAILLRLTYKSAGGKIGAVIKVFVRRGRDGGRRFVAVI